MNSSKLMFRKTVLLFAMVFTCSNFIIGQSFANLYPSDEYDIITGIKETDSGFELSTRNTSLDVTPPSREILNVDASGNFISSTFNPNSPYRSLRSGNFLKSPERFGETELNYTIFNSAGQVVNSFDIDFPSTVSSVGGGTVGEYANGDLLISYRVGFTTSKIARVSVSGQVIWEIDADFNSFGSSNGDWLAAGIAINDAQEAFIQINSNTDDFRMLKVTADGTILFNKQSGFTSKFPGSLTPSTDGGVWFIFNGSIRKWDAAGNQLTSINVDPLLRTFTFPQRLLKTGDGGVIVLGRAGASDIYIFRMDGTGNEIYLNRIDDLPFDVERVPGGLLLDSGEVVFSGQTQEDVAFFGKVNENGEFVSTSGGGCTVNITPSNGGATITGLTSDANTKLFDANTTIVWECNPWQNTPCSSTETVTGLTAGNYFLSVQSANCEEWIPVTIAGGGCSDQDGDGICDADDCQPNNPSLPTVAGDTCNDFNSNTTNDIIQSDGCTCAGTPMTNSCNVNVTSSNGAVTITGLTSDINTKLFNADISSVWECNPWQNNPCAGTENVTGLSAGNYFLSVQSDVCNEWIPITITGGGCSDADNDGICDADDCQPNDSAFPATPGANCNDSNSNTTNDVVQSDGCSCAGTPATGGCNVDVTSSNGGITITGLTSDINTKLFNADISSVWECNPWQSNPCSGNETVTGLITGANYFLSVQSDVCNEWIPVTVQGGSSTATCNDGIQNQGEAGVDCGGPCIACGGNNDDPQITCPDDITVTATSSNNGAVVFWDDAEIITANCTPFLINTFPTSGSFLPVGTTEVIYSYGLAGSELDCGVNQFCSFNVTVLPPDGGNSGNSVVSLECSGDLVFQLAPGEFSTDILYDFSATTTCTQSSNVTFDIFGFNSGTNLLAGSYPVRITATDECGSGESCSIDITILPPGNTCIDVDNDGICADLDCDDNDNSIPGVPGSFCNDNNSNTENDIIQNDGCTCAGTPIGNIGGDCSFTGNYISSFYEESNSLGGGETRIVDIETIETEDGYELVFLYQKSSDYWSQRLFLDPDGNVNGEQPVRSHGSPNSGTSQPSISADFDAHFEAVGGSSPTFTLNKVSSIDQSVDFSKSYSLPNNVSIVSNFRVQEIENRLIIFGTAVVQNDFSNPASFVVVTDLDGNEIGREFIPTTVLSSLNPALLNTTMTPDGGFLLEIESENRTFVVKTSASGAFEFRGAGIGDLTSNQFYFAGVASDGSGYYTAAEGGSNNFAYIRKSDLSDGSVIWEREIADDVFDSSVSVQGLQEIRGVELAPNGGVIASYATGSFPESDPFFISYDTNGNPTNIVDVPDEFEIDGTDSNDITNGLSDGGFILVRRPFRPVFVDVEDGAVQITRFLNNFETNPSCGGNPVNPTNCNVSITSANNAVTITGLSGDTNTKLFNADIATVWECNPWQSSPCSGNETVSGLIAGATYFLSVQSDVCDEWIPITIEGGNDGNGGNSNGPDLNLNGNNLGAGAPGQVLFFDFILWNTGNSVASGSYLIKSYISTDNILDDNDIQEGTIGTGNTPTGSTPVTGAITIPNLSPGTYFFFLVVDDGNAIAETDESNNIMTRTLTITSSLLDNQPTSFLSPSDTNAASFTVNNLFPNPTSGSVISQIESTFDGDISIQVTNILGQEMIRKTVPVAIGKNSLQLEMNDLQDGMYNVIFNYGNKVVAKQIVVSKN